MTRAAFAALFLLLGGWSAALANDSTAEMVAGGLVLVRTDAIEMQSEDLFLSPARVRVRYVFVNRTNRAVRTRVAFPMPDANLAEVREWDHSFPDDFRTLVDGRPVRMAVERRAMLGTADYSALLARHSIPLVDDENQGQQRALDRLGPDARRALLAAGLVEDLSRGVGGRLAAIWTVRETWHWEQDFPPGRPVRIEHSYAPGIGSTVGVPLSSRDFRDSEGGRDYSRQYCTDRAFLAALDRMAARAETRGPLIEQRFGYVLSTGSNWRGPIRDFRLVVDKGDPNAIMSLCAEGLRRISPTAFEMRRRNWRPDRDLDILIVRPASRD